jgi:hypothetical protein
MAVETADQVVRPQMSDPHYDAAWNDLRKRVSVMRRAEGGWFVLLLAVFGGMYITRSGHFIGWAIIGAGITIQLAFRGYADALLKGFLCPRCGARFLHVTSFGRAPLQAYNLHAPCQKCQLPLGATSENFDRAV